MLFGSDSTCLYNIVFFSECNSSYRHDNASMISGWWFGTFFIFPYIGNNHPNWLIFSRGVETTNQIYFYRSILVSIAFKIPLQGTFLLLSTWVSPRPPVKLRRIWTFGTEAGIMAMKTWCKGLINRNLYDSTGNTKFFWFWESLFSFFFDLQNQANEGMVKRRCHDSVRILLKIVVASLLPKNISPCFRATSKREIWVHVHVQVSLLANVFYHVLYICDVQFPSFESCIPLLDLLTETALMARFIPFHSYHLFLQFSQLPPNHQGTGEQTSQHVL